MKQQVKQLAIASIVAAVLAPGAAMATNGYFAHGYGTKNKGLAGAGVALPQDAMAAATNPAGMVWVGNRMDVGAALFSPSPRGYTVTGTPSGAPAFGLAPGTLESDSDYFIIPHFARNWMLDANSSVGLTIYGNGGMNTDYPNTAGGGVFYGGPAGVNLEQLFFNVSYSARIDATSSWGASVILAYQRFEAKGLSMFGTSSIDSANLTDRGVDDSTGFGFKLGWQGEVAPGLTLAVSYQSETQMSEFDNYRGLFAEQGDFDIPSTWTLGLAYDVSPTSKLVFDIQQINYSDVAAIANPLQPNITNCAQGTGDLTQCLGGSNGPGFGWEDMTIYKIGYQWDGSGGYTWRAGFSTGSQPIPPSEVLFNILAPGIMEEHFTFGFTKDTGPDSEFNFAAMYAPKSDLTGTNGMDPAQTITLEMTQWEVEASWAWKF